MILRQQTACLNTGEEAPDFVLPGQHGKMVRLSDYRGKKNVLLVLHPSRLDEVCKDHVAFYGLHLKEFEQHGTQLLVVNMDSVETNRRWAEKQEGLGFPLLSDFSPPGDMSLKYDCFVPKLGYGKRAMFLIDKSGKLQHVELLSGDRDACPDLRSVIDAVRKLDEQERRVG